MKKLLTIAAASVALAAAAADTDIGALVTTGNIEDVAKVTNLTGTNAGKATITINDNSGTAQAVTVYNAATMDTALSGKAATGDVATLQNRATALETATNNLSSAVATAQAAAATSYVNATNKVAQLYLPKYTGTNHYAAAYGPYVFSASNGNYPQNGGLAVCSKDVPQHFKSIDQFDLYSGGIILYNDGLLFYDFDKSSGQFWQTNYWPYALGKTSDPNRFALLKDITAVSNSLGSLAYSNSLAFASLTSKPTTIAGYGITDAKIASGTITLGSNTITPVPTSRKVNGSALTGDITITANNPNALSIVGSTTTTYNGSATASVNQTTATQTSTTNGGTTGKNLTIQVAATSLDMGAYYIKIGSDGKPHLMLRQ